MSFINHREFKNTYLTNNVDFLKDIFFKDPALRTEIIRQAELEEWDTLFYMIHLAAVGELPVTTKFEKIAREKKLADKLLSLHSRQTILNWFALDEKEKVEFLTSFADLFPEIIKHILF